MHFAERGCVLSALKREGFSRTPAGAPPVAVLVVAAVVLAVALPHPFAQAAAESDSILLTYSIGKPHIERTSEGWDRVAIEGLPSYGAPGHPVLPLRPCTILIPYGTEIEGVKVIPEQRVVLDGSYRVEPGATPVPLSRSYAAKPAKPDSAVYAKGSPVPGVDHSAVSTQRKRGFELLVLALHPVQYVPATGELSYCKTIRVEVELRAPVTTKAGQAPAETLPLRPIPALLKELAAEVDNPEALDTYPAEPPAAPMSGAQPLPTGGPYQYVVITAEAFKNAGTTYTLQDLCNARTAQGLNAVIVTVDGDCNGDGVPDGGIYANYSGLRPDGFSDQQTRIRNFIADAYSTWGTQYVLLAGDSDGAVVGGETENEIIPTRYLYAFAADGDHGDNIPADIYYSCLDGSYDYNANGVYGESTDGVGGGEVDLFAEVYVGRAAIDSASEISNFVAKTLAYETDADSDWLRRVEMVGEYLGFGGVSDFAASSMDEIREGTSNHGYTTVGFEDSRYAGLFDVATLYDRDYPGNDWPSSEIISIINLGVHGVNHLGHGANNWLMKMDRGNVLNDLTNTQYFIGYSQACYSGSFDDWSAYGPFVSYDCVVEHFSLDPHGCAAFVADSRYGWGSYNSTNGPSQHFDREFWDAILEERLFELGRANSDSKADQAWYVSSNLVGRWCAYELNLFGDPALRFRAVSSAGVVYMDRDCYGVPGPVEVTVLDVDLDLDPGAVDTAQVSLTSDTEVTPEFCLLTETEVDSQIFVGNMTLAVGAPSADGILQVAHGDTIVVTYNDADDGTGSPAVSTDQATIDLVPPQIADVQVSQIADTTALITWTTDEAAQSTVQYGPAQPPGSAASDEELVTNHSVQLTGLTPLTPYYFSVSSADFGSNLATDDNGGDYYYFVTRWRRTVFSDNMEAPKAKWSHAGTNDEWERGVPTYYDGPSSAHSPASCWGTDLDGDYSDYADFWLVLSSIPLGEGAQLEFWHWYMIEPSFDYALVEINDGSGWQNITPGGLYDGATFEWVKETIDLSAYTGTVSLSFRLVTDYSLTYPGWYVDDVSITRLGGCNFDVKDAAGETVFRITDTGDVLLKGTLLAEQGGGSVRATLGNEVLVKNCGEAPVARIDAATGNLYLEGTIATRQPSITTSPPSNLIVKDPAGNIIAVITPDGDMSIRGEVHELHVFE